MWLAYIARFGGGQTIQCYINLQILMAFGAVAFCDKIQETIIIVTENLISFCGVISHEKCTCKSFADSVGDTWRLFTIPTVCFIFYANMVTFLMQLIHVCFSYT